MPPKPDVTAVFDQHGAFLAQVAELMGQYMRALEKAGFSHVEAVELVAGYQTQFFAEIERARK
jgi:hypothetical protein